MLRALRLGLPLGVGSVGALAEATLFSCHYGFCLANTRWVPMLENCGFQQTGNGRPSPKRVLRAKVCEMEGGPRLNQGSINELTNLLYIAFGFPFYRALLATSSWYKFAL